MYSKGLLRRSSNLLDEETLKVLLFHTSFGLLKDYLYFILCYILKKSNNLVNFGNCSEMSIVDFP